MCTAIKFTCNDNYFGRTLDLDRSYGEEVCIMPRSFPLSFRTMGEMTKHYAMIGMAAVVNGIPLYYDAVNECGLAMAGLNFPENAFYSPICDGKDNIAPFELIPWILGICKSVTEAEGLISKLSLANIPFSEELPLSPLHWMIADKDRAIVVEAMNDGTRIYENKVGVMTNNPPFNLQLENLEKYKNLRNDNKGIIRNLSLGYSDYCQGLGAVGLPGDASSMSRFVRGAFKLKNSTRPENESEAVGQFFHIMASVEMVKGECKTDEGNWDITGYTSCMNTDRGLYYYTTYTNRRISCVDINKADLQGDKISRFSLNLSESIGYQN